MLLELGFTEGHHEYIKFCQLLDGLKDSQVGR